VVHGARRIKATFADGFSRDADLLGEDPDTDIAVVRIGANALPSVVLGSSRGLRSDSSRSRSAIRTASSTRSLPAS